jgi:hypothetical protein
VKACNRHDTLFITEKWFAPRKAKLLELLSDPVTADEAHVLRELLWERIPFQVVFDWLAEKPLSWAEYLKVKAEMREHRRWRMMVEGIFPWPDVEASQTTPITDPMLMPTPMPAHLGDQTCPCCSAPLTWIFFRSPSWTWRKLCGRAGWLAICERCHLQVDFRLTLMN